MKIGMIGHMHPCPPFGYGGVERSVAWWSEELQARGHEVTLFSHPLSRVNVTKLVPCNEGIEDKFYQAVAANPCDVIHDNNDIPNPRPERWAGGRYIFTVHACVKPPVPNTVLISNNQRKFFNDYASPVVHYGFQIDKIDWSAEKYDYLLWCGGLRGCKAPEMAIEAALETNQRLKIIGPIQDSKYLHYPQMYPPGGQIEYLGEMGDEKWGYYQKAKAFIYTCSDNWMEGFGLVNVEALLSGTPVLGRITETNQIVKEHYQEGVGGMYFSEYSDLVKLIKAKPWDQTVPILARVEGEKFNIKSCIDKYLNLYEDYSRVS